MTAPRFDDERVRLLQKIVQQHLRKSATVFTTLPLHISKVYQMLRKTTKVGIRRGLRLRGLERQQDICRRLPLILLHYTGSSPPI